jgi:uncharacterized damage-inducible protein DinB
MTDNFYTEFDETTEDLLRTISSFSQEQFNTIPFEGSWTAGQVAEHLLKSESGIPKILRGNTRPADRDSCEKVEAIRSIFLDFNSKMKSPEFILPSGEAKDKEIILSKFKTKLAETREMMDTTDLSQIFIDFPFPQLGEFTGWEWICFAICHAKRHTYQMKNILKVLEGQQHFSDKTV